MAWIGTGLNLADGLTKGTLSRTSYFQMFYPSMYDPSEHQIFEIELNALALAEQKQAKKAQEAQNVFAKNAEILKAQSSLLASGKAGNSISLLFADLGRQGGNFRESIRQELESFSRQYDRNIQGTESEYQNIRNRLRSRISLKD